MTWERAKREIEKRVNHDADPQQSRAMHRQNTATGFTGLPVPRGIFSGRAMNMKS
jgi:hypothetical protein